jgi:hypothetical protein
LLVKRVLKILHGFGVAGFAAECLEQFHWGSDLAEGRESQDFNIFYGFDAGVGVLIQQGIQNLAAGAFVLAEVVVLAHLGRAFFAAEWGLVVHDMADDVEWVGFRSQLFADFLNEVFPENAALA